jgi:hypothetical protein
MAGSGGSVRPCTDPLCNDHSWWTTGKAFRWTWPTFNVYKPADQRFRFLWNRYPHHKIGAGVVMFGRCWAVKWKR